MHRRRCPLQLMMCCNLLLLAAPRAQAQATTDEPPPGAGCVRPPVVGRLPRGAELDTTWVRFGSYLSGCRIVNRRHQWVASEPWFELTRGQEQFVNMATLDSMHEAGNFPDSEMIPVVGVRYRYLVHADSTKQARQQALAMRPRTAPTAVARALRKMRAKAEHDPHPSWY